MTHYNKFLLMMTITAVIVAVLIFVAFSFKNSPEKFNDIDSESPIQKEYEALKKRVDLYVPKKDTIDQDGNKVTFGDELYMKICCQLALRSVVLENFGIGCIIVDPKGTLKPHLKDAVVEVDGKQTNYLEFIKKMLDTLGYNNADVKTKEYLDKIVGLGFNQIFNQGFFVKPEPHFRSDRHGEMVTMDLLENAISSVPYKLEWAKKMPEGLTLYTQLESCVMCLGRLATSNISHVLHGAPDNGGGMVHRMCDLPPAFVNLTNKQVYAPANISANNGPGQDNLVNLALSCFSVNVGLISGKLRNRPYGCPENCPNMNNCKPMTNKDMLKRATYDTAGWTRY